MKTIAARYEQALCFAAVAEAASFTRAAEALGRSKAHVSKRVSDLEQALGVQLLLRTTRRLALTEAGQTYLEYCRQLRETLVEGERAVSAARAEVGGTLRLTAPTSFGDIFLAELLLAFQAAHPALRIELDVSIQRRDLIGEQYDFAFRTTRVLEERLVARAIGSSHDAVVAAPKYLAAHPPLRAPADLAGLDCLLNTHFRDDPEWLFSREGRIETVRVSGRFAVNSYGLIRVAALLGGGVARLPRFMIDPDLLSGRLVEVLGDYRLTPTPIYLVYPQRRHMPHRNRVFRDFVVEWFAQPERAALLG